jgi:hypothetical protein
VPGEQRRPGRHGGSIRPAVAPPMRRNDPPRAMAHHIVMLGTGRDKSRTCDLVLIRETAPASNSFPGQQVTDAASDACIPDCTANTRTSSGDTKSKSLNKTFTEALAMIASLPLSEAEKAEAVRRLLAGRQTGA